MGYKVIFSERSIRDLQEICKYIAAENPGVALRVGKDLIREAVKLSDFPRVGKFFCQHIEGDIHEKVFLNYRVFYRIDELSKNIEILHYRHGARHDSSVF